MSDPCQSGPFPVVVVPRPLASAASHRAVATAPRGCRVSYSRSVPENSPKNQRVADETVDLSAIAHSLEPALSGLRELLAPLVQVIERERARWNTALTTAHGSSYTFRHGGYSKYLSSATSIVAQPSTFTSSQSLFEVPSTEARQQPSRDNDERKGFLEGLR